MEFRRVFDTIPEPYKTSLLEGLRKAVREAGYRIELRDTPVFYLARKPE